MYRRLCFVSIFCLIVSFSLQAGDKSSTESLMAAIKSANYMELQNIVNSGVALYTRDKSGDTPLLKAVKANDLEAVKILLYGGADPSLKDAAGDGAATIAFKKNYDVIFKLLNLFKEKRDEFIAAVKTGNIEQLRKSILAGINVNISNNQGQTPLMLAAWMGNINVLQELIIVGGQLYRKDSEGNTVFSIIASRGDAVAKQLLVNYGVDPKLFVANFKVPDEVQQYGMAHRQLITAEKQNFTVEQLYEGGKFATSKLKPVLQTLEPIAYDMAKTLMNGFKINRGENGVLAYPDPLHFARLSSLKGRDEDKEFFTLQYQTKPDLLPVYIKQQSATNGCIIYGRDILSKLFSGWLAFQKKYPEAYKTEVAQSIKGLQDTFLGNMCACEGEETVIKEFEAFIKTKASSEISKQLKQRLDNIRNKKSTIEFNCKPDRVNS